MYIVTGGAGLIGSALVRQLNNMGIFDILVVDNLASTEKWKNLTKARYLAYMHRDEFLRHIRQDSLEEALLLEQVAPVTHEQSVHDQLTHAKPAPGEQIVPYVAKVQGIVHLGACSSTTERDADYLMRNNLEYSKILCDYALRRGIRFIQASSAATYGDGAQGFDDDDSRLDCLRPLNMYGYSKHLFDLWAARTGRLGSIVSIKFFNVYGPNEYHKGDMRSMVQKAVEQIKATGQVRLFKSYHQGYADGGQVRDFIYVKDCAEVLAALLEQPQINGVFNLGTGTARSWNDLANAVFAAMELEPRIEYIEMPEILRGKYQYYTQARMQRLARAFKCAEQPLVLPGQEDSLCWNRCSSGNTPVVLRSLEAGVADYVRNYLLKDDQYI